MGIVKDTVKKIFGMDTRKDVSVNLTPTSDEQERALQQENSTLKAQLARISAEQKKGRDQQKQTDKQLEEIQTLREDESKINKDRYGETISLGKFFQQLMFDKEFRNRLELTDKDDKAIFGGFGDLLITKNRGTFVITDINGNPMVESKSIDGIFYKPQGLDNQLKRGRIALPVDENFNQIIDLEELEMQLVDESNITDDFNPDEQRFYLTREARKKVKNIMLDYIKELNEKNNTIEILELTNNDIKKENMELKRGNTVLKN